MGSLRRLRFLAVGASIVLLAVLCAVLAPWLAPHDPYLQAVSVRLIPPVWDAGGTWRHPLGTDPLGRDLLSRIIYGAQVSISAGALAVLVAMTLGVLMGLLAGYYGGGVDAIISNLVNVMLAFPFLLLALAAIAVVGPSFGNMIVVLGVTGWPVYTRVVRAETLKYREREFVQAARALGLGSSRIIWAHVLPNLVNTIIVMASLEVARMIILESFLSFLGLGIQPPIPSWGAMLGEGRVYMLTHWWLAAFPGLAIFVTTLGINLFGDGLRDVLDPHRVLTAAAARTE
ncbi:MAG: ABC transporter permease [Candidatus Rokubacteria bacterium]|nr:ABC transporter permease [Candidatus Rokubacteria bacterium]